MRGGTDSRFTRAPSRALVPPCIALLMYSSLLRLNEEPLLRLA